jgi:hypothetical protein
VLRDADPDAALSAGDAGGDVQQPVAQRFRLGRGQLAVEQGGLGPGDQVGGGERQLEPDGVDRELPGWEPATAGVFEAADAVLDPVGAVPGLQLGQLPAGCVGGEGLVAPAVAVLEQAQLRTGMRAG